MLVIGGHEVAGCGRAEARQGAEKKRGRKAAKFDGLAGAKGWKTTVTSTSTCVTINSSYKQAMTAYSR